MKKYTFHIAGTHCASCKILVEDAVQAHSFIKNPTVDITHETLSFETDSKKNPQELASFITNTIQKDGYSISVEKKIITEESDDTLYKAIPIGLAFLLAFFVLQKSGILNIGIGENSTTPLTSFFIGLIASVSSCLAVVGGLVLSLSAKTAQNTKNDKKIFMLFHIGRLVSFGILGGVLGAIGNAIGINFTFTALLGILASVVMMMLGLQLLGFFKKNKITLPSGIFNFFRKMEHETFTPLFLGFGTFFLPCGFTQSLQISALASGSFLSGFFIMFAFALGTFPMLALLSFGSSSFAHSPSAPLFFKSAGIGVLGLGIFSLLAGLSALGIIHPFLNL